MAEEPTKTPVSEVRDHAPASEPVKGVWYHSTLFNAFVIGGVGMSVCHYRAQHDFNRAK